MDPLIRPFRPGDEPALWEVFYSAIHGIASADYTTEQLNAWAPADFDARKWGDRIRGIAPFVAEEHDEIIGYADVQVNGYIDHFFVSATAARRGVGSALMQRIHETALSRGTERLFSDVSVTARPFFETWGFEVERAQTVSMRGVRLNNFRMCKHRLMRR